jgi:ankyrin repeat protein
MRGFFSFLVIGLLLAGHGHAAGRDERIHAAILKNDVAAVRVLLKADAKPERRKDTRASPTFLTQAARLGRDEIVSLLIAAGANVNAPDGDNMSPLLHACANGHARIVDMLLKAGADVTDRSKWGDSALGLARKGKHGAVASRLERAGAKE